MNDDTETPRTGASSALQYPFAAPPALGETLEVAPGVLWMRMPLPFAPLVHINIWALDDGEGWAVVDTGVRSEETAATWRRLFANAPEPHSFRCAPAASLQASAGASDGAGAARRPSLTRIFVTHMHPDHVGMAGWLTRKFGCRLWMTRLEYLTCRVLASDTGREAPDEAVAFYREAGWSDAAIESYRARFGDFGKFIYALPDSYRRIRDGEEIAIGRHTWRVIVGTGHSPEHACLYCPELKVLIAGDQVLPRISSNVSVHPTEPDADPMADWFDSLARLEREVPDDVLVLPAHNECFRGLHSRLRQLAQGQERAFARLREALREPRRVVDVFATLFSRPIGEADHHHLSMATGEAVACLNHLVHRGEVERSAADDGVAWYRLRSA